LQETPLDLSIRRNDAQKAPQQQQPPLNGTTPKSTPSGQRKRKRPTQSKTENNVLNGIFNPIDDEKMKPTESMKIEQQKSEDCCCWSTSQFIGKKACNRYSISVSFFKSFVKFESA
jgi:hypothetical protein